MPSFLTADTVRAQQIATLVGILIVTYVIARLASARVPRVFPSASVIRSVVRLCIYAVGILVALGSVGISIAPVLTALGVGGLAVALALKDTLANLFAGIQLLASRQVEPGDYIRFEGGEGIVADITWRNTTLVDVSGARVIVPNEKLAGSVVTNATTAGGLRFSYAFALPRAIAPSAVRDRLAQVKDSPLAGLAVTASSDAATSYTATFHVEHGSAEEIRSTRAAVAEAAAELAASV